MRRVRRKGGSKEKVFGCDLLEHLNASSQEGESTARPFQGKAQVSPSVSCTEDGSSRPSSILFLLHLKTLKQKEKMFRKVFGSVQFSTVYPRGVIKGATQLLVPIPPLVLVSVHLEIVL